MRMKSEALLKLENTIRCAHARCARAPPCGERPTRIAQIALVQNTSGPISNYTILIHSNVKYGSYRMRYCVFCAVYDRILSTDVRHLCSNSRTSMPSCLMIYYIIVLFLWGSLCFAYTSRNSYMRVWWVGDFETWTLQIRDLYFWFHVLNY